MSKRELYLEDAEIEERVALLTQHTDKIPVGSREFAKSLIKNHQEWGNLSDKQTYWLNRIAEDVKCALRGKPWPTLPKNETGEYQSPDGLYKANFGGVFRFLQRGSEHLKKPRVKFYQPDGLPLIFELKTDGTDGDEVHVVSGTLKNYAARRKYHVYGKREDYGRILSSGEWSPGRSPYIRLQRRYFVEQTLIEFAADPETYIASEGKRVGSCCYCAAALTDERSLEAGYGPVCAENYSLNWGDTIRETEVTP